ncbi:MAG: hypothetical protein QOC87_777 [Actinomycetota bacterium]|jgi:pSer/pThr/pTyr-binding forkhead associated (FHA) protein|nr:hypothetical protein [Actinomycetota bacterium]
MKLSIASGPLAGRTIDVTSDMSVGREQADLLLHDEEVSRAHAQISPKAAGLEIRDLGSLNGTWVNGNRIQAPTMLGAGDVVTIGASTIRVLSPSQEPRGLPADPFSPRSRRPRIASRRISATVFSIAVIASTGVALIVYFAGR